VLIFRATNVVEFSRKANSDGRRLPDGRVRRRFGCAVLALFPSCCRWAGMALLGAIFNLGLLSTGVTARSPPAGHHRDHPVRQILLANSVLAIYGRSPQVAWRDGSRRLASSSGPVYLDSRICCHPRSTMILVVFNTGSSSTPCWAKSCRPLAGQGDGVADRHFPSPP